MRCCFFGAHRDACERSDQSHGPRASEEQEVREFARRFAVRVEKTRDLGPYLNSPPASNFSKEPSRIQTILVGIVDKDVVSKVGTYQLGEAPRKERVGTLFARHLA